MSESPFSFESWATAQAAMLKSMFPTPADAGGAPAAVPPLQEQFEELRDTWTESINRWSEFVKEGGAFDFSKPESLRAMFAPERWLGNGAGVFDIGLRQVLEGPKYATLFDLDRKLLELRQLATRRDQNVAAFQAVLMKGWNTAFAKFSKEDADACFAKRVDPDRFTIVSAGSFGGPEGSSVTESAVSSEGGSHSQTSPVP